MISGILDGFIHPHIRQHFLYYISVVLLQLASYYGVYLAYPHIPTQMLVVVSTSIVYVIWASFHHYINHNLHPQVVLEYILMGFLGTSIAFFMFQMQS